MAIFTLATFVRARNAETAHFRLTGARAFMRATGAMTKSMARGIRSRNRANTRDNLLSKDINAKNSDIFHGVGVYCESDGTVYDGDWANNAKSGMAHVKYANGESYVGEFKFGKRHGKGQYMYANGEIYSGDFMNDMRHGVGHIIKGGGIVTEGKVTSKSYRNLG